MTLETTDGTTKLHAWLQSVVALLAGFAAVAVLSVAADSAFQALGVYPPGREPMNEVGDNLLALSYRCVFGALGSYIAARLAPSRPMAHAMILGAIGTAVATLGVAATWNLNLGPRWYPIALAATALPCAWIGGVAGTKGR
ncbi:hypothetical protein [Phenylobacterium sp.]|uniref:hypothetical protein n=1 Tax=Phenylobacterium sp. TaxID=1871053 RepID=UPI003BA9BE10